MLKSTIFAVTAAALWASAANASGTVQPTTILAANAATDDGVVTSAGQSDTTKKKKKKAATGTESEQRGS